MKELEKNNLFRIISIGAFAPFLFSLVRKDKLTDWDRRILLMAGSGILIFTGNAYRINRHRLQELAGLFHENKERTVQEVLDSQDVRLYADLMFIAPFLLYLSGKTKLTETAKMGVFMVAVATSLYNRKFLAEDLRQVATLADLYVFFGA